ncbi:MAG: diacylglyceryl transferase, partial [Deinococcus sp.]|nr:diacylglyceryl transferase [Deinococcus sp.]
DKPGIGLWTETHLISIPLILVSIWLLMRLRRQPDTRVDPVPSATKQNPA